MNLTEEQKNNEIHQIIKDIQKINPQPTEAITLFYDMENLSLEEYRDIFDHLNNEFPQNTVLMLPNKVSLKSCSKKELKDIVSAITEVIEEL